MTLKPEEMLYLGTCLIWSTSFGARWEYEGFRV